MSASLAIHALHSWADACPHQQKAIMALIDEAERIAFQDTVHRVKTRVSSYGIDAAQVVWSDARCPKRSDGSHAVGRYSLDLFTLCKQSSIYFAPQQHMHDLDLAASLPLSDVTFNDGQNLEDILIDEFHVRSTPEKAEMRVQGLVVFSDQATLKFCTRAYGAAANGLQTHTIVRFCMDDEVVYGYRTGSGEVGVHGKALHFAAAEKKENAAVARLYVITLWTNISLSTPAPVEPDRSKWSADKPVYRSLTAATVTLSDEDVPEHDRSILAGLHVYAARIEEIACHTAHHGATDDEIDAFAKLVLQKQVELGTQPGERADRAKRALEDLQDLAYCSNGHGPWKRNSSCPGCGKRVVCNNVKASA